jgi:hypothetical protein
LVLFIVLGWTAAADRRAAEADDVADIRRQTGIRAGLCVHLGTTDGSLEADLAADGQLLVHGLTSDLKELQGARRTIHDRELYGLASVQYTASLKHLPYASDLVNLLVADLDALAAHTPDEGEMMRVLAPMGVAAIKEGGKWRTLAKPVSNEMDDWPQWDHGPDGNPSSDDRLIGPTNTLRWMAGTTTINGAGSKVGLRINRGRVFYTNIDYGLHKYWNRRNLPRDVVARDAFNSVLLWKRAIDGVPGGGDQPPRFALTTDDGRVYCFPKEGGPMEAIDAATGQTLVRFEDAPSLPKVRGWDCGGGHSNKFGALGCFPTPGESKKILGETVDGALAKTIPGIFPHVGLGISKRLENSVIYNISAWGPDKGLPTRCKPDQAYAELFGSVAGGAAQQEFRAKKIQQQNAARLAPGIEHGSA